MEDAENELENNLWSKLLNREKIQLTQLTRVELKTYQINSILLHA